MSSKITDHLVELFETSGEKVTINMTEIAKTLSVCQSSVTRAVQKLEKNGVIQRTYGRTFRLRARDRKEEKSEEELQQRKKTADIITRQERIEERLSRIEEMIATLLQAVTSGAVQQPKIVAEATTDAAAATAAIVAEAAISAAEAKALQQRRSTAETTVEPDQLENINLFGEPDPSAKKSKGVTPSIPFDAIAAVYMAMLPELPKISKLSESRKRAVRARWNEARKSDLFKPYIDGGAQTEEEAGRMFFEDYFATVARSDFLTGRATAWHADFDWLMKPVSFTKVMEGNYGLGQPQRIAEPIVVRNDHDRALVEQIRQEHGQGRLDEAIKQLVRQGTPPTPSVIMKTIKEIVHYEDPQNDTRTGFGEEELDYESFSRAYDEKRNRERNETALVIDADAVQRGISEELIWNQ